MKAKRKRSSEFGLGLEVSATKIFRWEGAHQLTDSEEKGCQNIHGHSYKLEVTLTTEGSELNKMGMVIDFKIISQIVDPFIEKFDHQFITEDTFGRNPTAENMAIMLMEELGVKVPEVLGEGTCVYCSQIRLWETDKCCVTVKFPKEPFVHVCS